MFESRVQVSLTIGAGSRVDPSGLPPVRAEAPLAACCGSRRTVPASMRPADWIAGSGAGIVIVVRSTARYADWSMAPATLGFREPAGPGTTTEASTAMSAALATTRGSRTSPGSLPGIAVCSRQRWSLWWITEELQRNDRCRRAPWAFALEGHLARSPARPPDGPWLARAGLRRPDDARRGGSGDSRFRDAGRPGIDRDPRGGDGRPSASVGAGRGAAARGPPGAAWSRRRPLR